jgi:hypothetical protein
MDCISRRPITEEYGSCDCRGLGVSYHKLLSHTLTNLGRQREPESLLDALDPETKLESHLPYMEAPNDDECEEEIEDSGSELEEYYNSFPNEYETDEQYYQALAEEDEEEDSVMGEADDDDDEDDDDDLSD